MPDILIHAHVYYPELWDELADCIGNIDADFDLYVTTVGTNTVLNQKITSRFAGAKILACENKGFDIAPFFKVLDAVDLDVYRYLVKIHTKRDVSYAAVFPNGYDLSGDGWRESLLLPFKTRENWKRTAAWLASDKTGMVADGKVIVNKLRSRDTGACACAKLLVEQFGLTYKGDCFVAGTMFAVKAALFKCLQNRSESLDFKDSIRGGDALPYACERLLGMIVSAQGKKIQALNDDMAKVRLHWLISAVLRFFFLKKTSEKKTIVKICKIPVFIKRNRKNL